MKMENSLQTKNALLHLSYLADYWENYKEKSEEIQGMIDRIMEMECKERAQKMLDYRRSRKGK